MSTERFVSTLSAGLYAEWLGSSDVDRLYMQLAAAGMESGVEREACEAFLALCAVQMRGVV